MVGGLLVPNRIRIYCGILIGSFMHSRWQTGGENSALSSSICVQLTVALPMSSKPESQLYIAVSPMELPVNVTIPSSIVGSQQSAVMIT